MVVCVLPVVELLEWSLTVFKCSRSWSTVVSVCRGCVVAGVHCAGLESLGMW